jgi:hypothetical protein
VRMLLSVEALFFANAASKDPNQAWHTCKNRFEAGPAERQIN